MPAPSRGSAAWPTASGSTAEASRTWGAPQAPQPRCRPMGRTPHSGTPRCRKMGIHPDDGAPSSAYNGSMTTSSPAPVPVVATADAFVGHLAARPGRSSLRAVSHHGPRTAPRAAPHPGVEPWRRARAPRARRAARTPDGRRPLAEQGEHGVAAVVRLGLLPLVGADDRRAHHAAAGRAPRSGLGRRHVWGETDGGHPPLGDRRAPSSSGPLVRRPTATSVRARRGRTGPSPAQRARSGPGRPLRGRRSAVWL